MQLQQFANDARALEGVNAVSPYNGNKPVTWREHPTHVVVYGLAPGIPRLARAFGLYPVCRLRGGWEILPADAGGQVAHVLMTAYDETPGWRDEDLGMNLAYLAMAMLQKTRPLVYRKSASEEAPFVRFLRSRFHTTHPLWNYIQIQ